MVDGGVPTSGGPSCCGLALIDSIWRIPSLHFRLKALCKVPRALRNAEGARQGHPPGIAGDSPGTALWRAKEQFDEMRGALAVLIGAALGH